MFEKSKQQQKTTTKRNEEKKRRKKKKKKSPVLDFVERFMQIILKKKIFSPFKSLKCVIATHFKVFRSTFPFSFLQETHSLLERG